LITHKSMREIANEISMKLWISDRLTDYHLDQIKDYIVIKLAYPYKRTSEQIPITIR